MKKHEIMVLCNEVIKRTNVDSGVLLVTLGALLVAGLALLIVFLK